MTAGHRPSGLSSSASEHVATLRGLYHCARSRRGPLDSRLRHADRQECLRHKGFQKRVMAGSSGREKSSPATRMNELDQRQPLRDLEQIEVRPWLAVPLAKSARR